MSFGFITPTFVFKVHIQTSGMGFNTPTLVGIVRVWYYNLLVRNSTSFFTLLPCVDGFADLYTFELLFVICFLLFEASLLKGLHNISSPWLTTFGHKPVIWYLMGMGKLYHHCYINNLWIVYVVGNFTLYTPNCSCIMFMDLLMKWYYCLERSLIFYKYFLYINLHIK